MPLDPMLRGDVVGSNDVIREAHNAFTRNDPFVSEGNNDKGGKKEVRARGGLKGLRGEGGEVLL